ncbi:hypothetical protein NL676_013774 [Syzygium grande]|nr:hypothetical protein NL676_013774 [Syzygium grande]
MSLTFKEKAETVVLKRHRFSDVSCESSLSRIKVFKLNMCQLHVLDLWIDSEFRLGHEFCNFSGHGFVEDLRNERQKLETGRSASRLRRSFFKRKRHRRG